jgi:hypothetical protein
MSRATAKAIKPQAAQGPSHTTVGGPTRIDAIRQKPHASCYLFGPQQLAAAKH